jgi:hypothetical protein
MSVLLMSESWPNTSHRVHIFTHTSGIPKTSGELVDADKRPVYKSIVDSTSSLLDHATARTLAFAPGVIDEMTALSMSALATPGENREWSEERIATIVKRVKSVSALATPGENREWSEERNAVKSKSSQESDEIEASKQCEE